MSTLPPVFIEFIGNATGFMATAKGVKTELASVETEGGGSIAKLGAVSKAALAGIGIAAGVAAYKTVKMAADFQASMNTINTQAGVSKTQVKSLGDGVLALAGQVGFSPTSLSQALFHVESSFASIGIKGPQALNILKIAAEGAAVGHANLVDVTNALDAAVASGIPGVQNMSQAMGQLNAIVGSGDMEMQDLADALGTGVLAVVKGYGLSLTDVGAALATFGDNNIRGAAAATDLRMSVQAMAVPAHSATEYLNEFGMSTTTLSDDMQKGGLKLALNDLVDRMRKAGVTSKEQGQVITEMFGKKAGSGLAVLAGQLDRVNSKYPELAKGATGFGDAWATTQKNFNQELNSLKSGFDAIAISIGQVLLPYATKFLQWVTSSMTFISHHRTLVIALAGAIGGILVIGLAAAAVAAWNFTAALLANPVVWIVVGVMALIAALVLLIMHWRAVWNFIKDVGKAIGDAVVGVWNWIASETSQIWDSYIVGPIMAAWHAVAAFFSSAWHAVADPIVNAWHWISSITSTIWNGISGFFRKWWPLLFVIFATPIAVLVALWNHTHQAMFTVVKAVWNAVSSFFRTIWQAIVTAATAIWNPVATFFSALWRGISSAASAVWHVIASFLSTEWKGISTAARTIWNLISQYIVTPIANVVSAVKSRMTQVANAVMSGAKSALNFVSRIWSTIVNVGRDIVNGIVSGVKSAGSALFNSLQNLASGALNAAKSFLGINSPSRVFADVVGKSIPEGIAKGISDNAHVAHSAISSMATTLTSGFNGNLSSGISAGLQSAQDMAGGLFSGLSTSNNLQLSGASGGSSVVNTVHVTVQGSVRSDKDLRDVVQQEVLKLNARNRSNGLTFKR